MKYLVIGLGILSLLVVFCRYGEMEIKESTQQVAVPLELAITALQAENESQARTYIALANDIWTQKESTLASLISHDHTNQIGEELAKLAWIPTNELRPAVEVVLKLVRNLTEMERILWKNIL